MAIGNSINSGAPISLAGAFTSSGAFAFTFTFTGITNVTFPTSGTLATTSQFYSVVEVTGTSQTIAVNTGYIANNAGLVTFTLPATAAVGQEFDIVGLGAGGWSIAQGAGQLIRVGSSVSTTGVGGSVSSSNRYDSIRLRCVVTNTTYNVVGGPQGNLTIV